MLVETAGIAVVDGLVPCKSSCRPAVFSMSAEVAS